MYVDSGNIRDNGERGKENSKYQCLNELSKHECKGERAANHN